ncbi:YbcN family protein [Dickeya solani]|uniref:YbcN family protein n=1 Tax=Dickeya solani TaxID=1089444 RepID=A0ABU4EPV0_9GAMM|nr:YbcN family protein [Dickeya solani]MCA6998193.1 YbcN family protein [Dickeya solani]MDV6997176.1 YbcN family protein [Dickeya solani]MDV7004487.1 YbcN family protein [Dickeya solani]MDV7040351.1 YbcN family protein [Dickeya solani]MDV7044802.1 YbcN family protein [Dickeya solani]
MNISQDGIRLHQSNFHAVGQQISELLAGGDCYRLTLKPWREKRSIPQNATLHMWFGEISEYLIQSGRADATPEWVKRNLKKTYLGCTEVTYTDFVTGEKTTTWEPRHTAELDTGEMHFFMTQVEAWCAQFGLALTVPIGCEYQQLKQRQEA